METIKKIELLGESAKYDLCGSASCSTAPRVSTPLDRWIYPAVLPDGNTIRMLKVLQSNACENTCHYCVNNRNRNFLRTTFQPEELSRLFIEMVYKGLVQGLFLSSAIIVNASRTMEYMIKTVELVRIRYKFRGYVHLKILPGVKESYVQRAVMLADRVSVNVEVPHLKYLNRIAPEKDMTDGILKPIELIRKYRNLNEERRVSQTTQFIVGAAGESDREIVGLTNRFYKQVEMKRVYYSAFQPVEGTPLENEKPTPLMREHRLYQADFLLRKYDFQYEEICFEDDGNLSLKKDPKRAWVDVHPELFPLEINRASYEELLRVPGIGPVSAKRIVNYRTKTKFNDFMQLKHFGVVLKWANRFLTINGKYSPSANQLELGLT